MIDAPALWRAVFGNDHPVVVEIGPGRGEFLVAYARTHPDQNILGIERSPARTAEIQRRLAAAELANARVLTGDAICVLALLPDGWVAAYHILFPDPWWKRRHQRRRLFTGTLVSLARRTLEPGGTIELVTDVAEYFTRARQLLDADPELEPVSTGGTGAIHTSFARKAERRGAPLYRCVYRRRR